MKHCDLCQREATVFYQVTYNGRTEQKNLCAECAAKQGIPAGFFSPLEQVFSLFPQGLRPSRFALPAESDFFLLNDSGAAQTSAPVSDEASGRDAEQSPAAPSLATLKAQLKRAVRAEDYMRAAALRDQIRAMEGK